MTNIDRVNEVIEESTRLMSMASDEIIRLSKMEDFNNNYRSVVCEVLVSLGYAEDEWLADDKILDIMDKKGLLEEE